MNNVRIAIVEHGKPLNLSMDVPEKWDEVPSDIYPHLAKIYMAEPHEMGAEDKAVRALILLTGEHYKTISKLNAEEVYDLLPLVDWAFEKLDLVKNHQPELTIEDMVLIGPDDGMENLRFAEFCMADTFFINSLKNAREDEMDKMIACIYRPPGEGFEFQPGHATYRGDRRQKFNDQLVAERAKYISRLSKVQKQGILVWFASCRNQIINQYPEFFPPRKTDEKPTDSPEDAERWLALYDDLRGDPKYGGAEKLEDEFLHTILHSQNRAIIKMNKIRKEYR